PRETATHTVQQLLLKVDAHARLRLVMNDTQIVPTVLGIASVVPKHLLKIRPRSRLKPRAVTDTHQAVLNGIVTVSRNSSRRCARKGPGRKRISTALENPSGITSNSTQISTVNVPSGLVCSWTTSVAPRSSKCPVAPALRASSSSA